jgi:biopolymer transport protein ExbD
MAFGGFDDRDGPMRPMAEINTTPLVDVMLVLLVIFIITAPLLTHAIRLDLPKAGAAPSSATPATVVVSIDAQGRVFWDDAPLGRRGRARGEAVGGRGPRAAARAAAARGPRDPLPADRRRDGGRAARRARADRLRDRPDDGARRRPLSDAPSGPGAAGRLGPVARVARRDRAPVAHSVRCGASTERPATRRRTASRGCGSTGR